MINSVQSKGWWKDGACLEIEGALELFEASGKFTSKRNEARSICRACLVRKDCLEEALKDNIEGFYGGTTFDERQMMRTIMLATGQTLDALYGTPPIQEEPVNHTNIRPYNESTPKFVLLLPSSVVHFEGSFSEAQEFHNPPVPMLKFA